VGCWVESVILSLAGGAFGLGLAKIGIRGIFSLYPEANPFNMLELGTTIPRIGTAGSAVTLDWRVLTFALVLSVTRASSLDCFRHSRRRDRIRTPY
jgi:hypothetical protein